MHASAEALPGTIRPTETSAELNTGGDRTRPAFVRCPAASDQGGCHPEAGRVDDPLAARPTEWHRADPRMKLCARARVELLLAVGAPRGGFTVPLTTSAMCAFSCRMLIAAPRLYSDTGELAAGDE